MWNSEIQVRSLDVYRGKTYGTMFDDEYPGSGEPMVPPNTERQKANDFLGASMFGMASIAGIAGMFFTFGMDLTKQFVYASGHFFHDETLAQATDPAITGDAAADVMSNLMSPENIRLFLDPTQSDVGKLLPNFIVTGDDVTITLPDGGEPQVINNLTDEQIDALQNVFADLANMRDIMATVLMKDQDTFIHPDGADSVLDAFAQSFSTGQVDQSAMNAAQDAFEAMSTALALEDASGGGDVLEAWNAHITERAEVIGAIRDDDGGLQKLAEVPADEFVKYLQNVSEDTIPQEYIDEAFKTLGQGNHSPEEFKDAWNTYTTEHHPELGIDDSQWESFSMGTDKFLQAFGNLDDRGFSDIVANNVEEQLVAEIASATSDLLGLMSK